MSLDSLISLLLLLGTLLLSAAVRALQTLGRLRARDMFHRSPRLFFLPRLFSRNMRESEWRSCLKITSSAKILYQILFVGFGALVIEGSAQLHPTLNILTLLIFSVGVDALLSPLASLRSAEVLRLLALPAILFILPALILLLPLGWLLSRWFTICGAKRLPPPHHFKEKISEILEDLRGQLSAEERQLIHSLPAFHEKICREVMVPRVDVFALPSSITIAEAATKLVSEGFSRVPVYTETIDNLDGVLFTKDVLAVYAGEKSDIGPDASITTLLRPVLYTPETKKIAPLLQEFREKQSHLAIVVDEYAGTAGLITLEDIVEEFIGEIEDEYDDNHEKLYTKLSNGNFLIDARLPISELETLGFELPTKGDFDTVGGFVFHKVGEIPKKGHTIFLESLTLKVISSDNRSIKKLLLSRYSS